MTHHQAANNPTAQVRLPAIYAEDYGDRIEFGSIGYARVIKQNKRYVYVEVDSAAYKDLLSDAKHHSDSEQFEPEYMYYVRSARIALRELEKVGEPGAQ